MPAMSEQPQLQYIAPSKMQDLMSYLLSLPSIPLSLKDQFFVLWELAPFSNLDNRDIQLMMVEFELWCDYFMWSIPDIYWSNVLEFARDSNGNNQVIDDPIRMDMNMLLSMLKQAYYMQLTRGKDGFTVKECTSARQIVKSEGYEQKKKGWSWF